MSGHIHAYREMLGQSNSSAFSAVQIKVASPQDIRSWSSGEVRNPETINYRTFKPEKGGLFCERIFGPTRDWECNCGKYKRVKHKGIICDRCGVEVTQSKVRRERMGHIDLAVPVSHIWFFKCMPSRIGLMLGKTARDLERIIYYESWVVTNKGDTTLEEGQILSELKYEEARKDFGDAFEADMGASAIKTLLERIDLPTEHANLEVLFAKTKNKAERKKLSTRLRLVEGFMTTGARPEWMILDVLPVIPPDLRPLVPLEGGRFATSDLNDLYRRVINRNNRLRNLLQLKTPEVIIRNEKRMLQEAVDALMDNGRHGRSVTGAGNRPLKSLSSMLKGKTGRFRQNLLGKRVDYSGRSVIVVGPELKLWQCGLPKKMALILFEPFIIRHLKARALAATVRSAKKMIERGEPVVWDILEEVSKGHPVLLNRAPTLHRLSIQAFDPVLIEGSAIRLHPLVCSAYNADFDGDQMAVHVPLSNEAQLETKLLMLAPNNIFSPANGKPITTPSQDIILGSYYLTHKPMHKDHPRSFLYHYEVLLALENGSVSMHDEIRIKNPDFGRQSIRGSANDKFIVTTAGRCIFNEIWDMGSEFFQSKRIVGKLPEITGDGIPLGFINSVVGKKELGGLISETYKHYGHANTVRILDDLKDNGYRYATRAGFSISITDFKIPDSKLKHIESAQKDIDTVMLQAKNGAITPGERHNKVIDIWKNTSNIIASDLYTLLSNNVALHREINPVFAMLDSGARGSKDQIRQLAGMRGCMAKPSGDIIERPILANFREGLSVLEYFISSHGARKGLADTALKTADSGYMTRKLVDVSQDIICRGLDCGTTNGILVEAITEGGETLLPLKARIVGRFTSHEIKDPVYSDRLIIGANEEITEEIGNIIEERGISKVRIRSVFTCELGRGVCVKCYGRNLASDRLAQIGDSLGIIAAQSIGEPGTQLTMRTFHIGGVSSSVFRQPQHVAKEKGFLHFENLRTVTNEKNETIVVSKNSEAVIMDADTNELERFELEVGSKLLKSEGQPVNTNDVFATWDPYNIPIIAEETGVVDLHDILEGVTLNREKLGQLTVMEHREDLHPQVVIRNKPNGDILNHYSLPAGATLMVAGKQKITPGTIVARIPRSTTKNKDITGGLPRIAEVFEARIPKEKAEIAKIDGIVSLSKVVKGQRVVTVTDPVTKAKEEHIIPSNKHLFVGKDDRVKKGQKLTEGGILLPMLLEICGAQELQRYMVNEIQKVYRAQGVEINDKHIEIVILQMMQKVKITDQGSSRFLNGEQIDRDEFRIENERVIENGGKPAVAEPVLLGITKASLKTNSFISAASFQDTTRILTEAATLGKYDTLRGFKENVITGHLIPAGTGIEEMQEIDYEVVQN